MKKILSALISVPSLFCTQACAQRKVVSDYNYRKAVESFFDDSDDDLDDFGESAVMGRPELIYTAITRAKQNLFVLNMGNGRFDDFFRNQNY